MNISDKISFIRKQLNLNQKDFAKLLDVTQAAISRYEKGDRKPDFAFLETLIKTLNINPMWLFLDYPDMYTSIELLFISQENLDLLKDINAALTQKELNEKLTEILIEEILSKFETSDEEKSPIYKFLEALKLEGHIPVRPFLFLYYIFQFILQDQNKALIKSYRKYLLDIIFSFKTLSWNNNPVFTQRIKNEISAKFELELSEEECKALVENANITLKKLEGKMPASMIKYHRNIKLKALFPSKFKTK
ncbi:helix-turn-helix domain-containing protein [Sulfurimonas hydrogeniphila]|uniref:helix-turn-helix domain-containing protein n=1 Tax=Sulfurimonas hydrogeniphila TaxID=2509341 RepID=UPI00125F8D94|nr:helix-turn-helix domain-containing protein [Sulfurimonas hydrogeniphila]